ncbi:MAG: L-fuculokinase [Bacteroidales bacterium]|nr:L-fuculokinase [Bacteroidales bacterium]
MPNKKISIVFDCGATNVKVHAINEKGEILSSRSYPNNTRPDPYYPEYRIWDVDEIWDKMCQASIEVVAELEKDNIIGVSVTTFGVDGALFSKEGEILYPMISWQCERTTPVMQGIGKYINVEELYHESALLPFNFNTINKIVWFKENKPELIEKAHMWLFAPSIFAWMLSGEMKNDITMAGTSMLTSASIRNLSPLILKSIGVDKDLFGGLAEPGEIIGVVNVEAAKLTGLPEGIPVVASGHDTQFAVFGSGAGVNQPVLSSGTWEILMVRSRRYRSGKEQLDNSISTELDPVPGLYNIGNQWIASGMLEWAGRNMFPECGDELHEKMIALAGEVPPGSNGIRVVPRFFEETGGSGGGQITGLRMESTREEIYRAMLESLSLRLREGMIALEKAGGFITDTILCVGGGSKNSLWNQIRADITFVPVTVIDKKETTVLGAAMFIMYAAGLASSPEEAREMIPFKSEVFEPGSDMRIYKELFF